MTNRPLVDSGQAGVPLMEQDLARLHIHTPPTLSYANDTLVEWALFRLAHDGLIPESDLVYGGRFLTAFDGALEGQPPSDAAAARSAFKKVQRWTRGLDPLTRRTLYFLDNLASGHWRLIAVVNPASLLRDLQPPAPARGEAPLGPLDAEPLWRFRHLPPGGGTPGPPS